MILAARDIGENKGGSFRNPTSDIRNRHSGFGADKAAAPKHIKYNYPLVSSP
jgi:hypothetical protein